MNKERGFVVICRTCSNPATSYWMEDGAWVGDCQECWDRKQAEIKEKGYCSE